MATQDSTTQPKHENVHHTPDFETLDTKRVLKYVLKKDGIKDYNDLTRTVLDTLRNGANTASIERVACMIVTASQNDHIRKVDVITMQFISMSHNVVRITTDTDVYYIVGPVTTYRHSRQAPVPETPVSTPPVVPVSTPQVETPVSKQEVIPPSMSIERQPLTWDITQEGDLWVLRMGFGYTTGVRIPFKISLLDLKVLNKVYNETHAIGGHLVLYFHDDQHETGVLAHMNVLGVVDSWIFNHGTSGSIAVNVDTKNAIIDRIYSILDGKPGHVMGPSKSGVYTMCIKRELLMEFHSANMNPDRVLFKRGSDFAYMVEGKSGYLLMCEGKCRTLDTPVYEGIISSLKDLKLIQ